MAVSKNSGTPQIIHFNRVFHYKPSILGYHHFRKHPYEVTPFFLMDCVEHFGDEYSMNRPPGYARITCSCTMSTIVNCD